MKFHEPIRCLLDSRAKLRLLTHLFSRREVEMSERELARVLGISNFSVNQLMKFFERQNLVERRRVGTTSLWRLKEGSYYSGLLDRVFKHLSTFPSPLEHLKKLVLSSYPLEQVLGIHLYGSVAVARESYNSDLDLFVLVKRSADKEEIERANEKLRVSCLALYGNTAQILVMDEVEYERKRSSALIRQVKRGIKIYPKRKDE